MVYDRSNQKKVKDIERGRIAWKINVSKSRIEQAMGHISKCFNIMGTHEIMGLRKSDVHKRPFTFSSYFHVHVHSYIYMPKKKLMEGSPIQYATCSYNTPCVSNKRVHIYKYI